MNAEEIQFIVDQLFVGNNLAAGTIKTSDGTMIDLRNIRSPIVVFCSKGDNITPPQQALGWILDLYESADDIRANGQTIVYSVHDKVGHLGIFVSSGVARKQYHEFSSNIDLIDVLPPGLYEATFEHSTADTSNPDASGGDWIMRCELRSLDDIRALGTNTPADDRCFAAAARVSEVNLALYRTFAQPFVRAFANPSSAEWMRKMHPLRLTYDLFSDANPMMAMFKPMISWARDNRRPASADNLYLAWQENVSQHIIAALDHWRDARDTWVEQTFFAMYDSPVHQAALGIDPASTQSLHKPGKNPLHEELLRQRTADLKARMPIGGLREATIRALLYVGIGRGAVDERGFNIVRRIRREHEDTQTLPLPEFKKIVRDQFSMLMLDQDAALAAIPSMLPNDLALRRQVFDAVARILGASGSLSEEDQRRLARITELFALDEGVVDSTNITTLPARAS